MKDLLASLLFLAALLLGGCESLYFPWPNLAGVGCMFLFALVLPGRKGATS